MIHHVGSIVTCGNPRFRLFCYMDNKRMLAVHCHYHRPRWPLQTKPYPWDKTMFNGFSPVNAQLETDKTPTETLLFRYGNSSTVNNSTLLSS